MSERPEPEGDSWDSAMGSVDQALLKLALTHRSMSKAFGLDSNERLEFLGDAVLGLAVGEHLYSLFPDRAEGELARAKGVVVRKSSLEEAARRTGIDSRVLLSRAEEAAGGRLRPAILADAFEAVVAALYLSRGYDAARDFVLSALAPEIAALADRADWRDAKTVLQEIRQGERLSPPVYETFLEEGDPHDRTFSVRVLLDGVPAGEGIGKSKRDAELAAAAAALEAIPVDS